MSYTVALQILEGADSQELSELSTKLLQYNISLKMYNDSFGKDDIG